METIESWVTTYKTTASKESLANFKLWFSLPVWWGQWDTT